MMMMMKWLCNADEDVEVVIMTVLRITIKMMISLMMTIMMRVVMVTLMRMIMMMGIMMMMMMLIMMMVVVVDDGVGVRSSVYKSSWGRVDSKGLYGRWRFPLIAFWSAIFPFSKG